MRITLSELKNIIRKEIKILMEVPLVGYNGEENQVYNYEDIKGHLEQTKTKYHLIYINDPEFNLIDLVPENDDYNTFAYASRQTLKEKGIERLGGISIESIPADHKIIIINKNAFIGQSSLNAVLTKYFDHDLGHTTIDFNIEREIIQLLQNIKNDVIDYSRTWRDKGKTYIEQLERGIINVFFGPNIYDPEFGLEDQTANFAFSIIKMIEKSNFAESKMIQQINKINLDYLLTELNKVVDNFSFEKEKKEEDKLQVHINLLKTKIISLIPKIEEKFLNTDYISFIGFK